VNIAKITIEYLLELTEKAVWTTVLSCLIDQRLGMLANDVTHDLNRTLALISSRAEVQWLINWQIF